MTTGTPSTLVPKLRFPAFRDAGEWEAKPLNDLCDRLTETVGDSQLTPVSISAGKGFVPQAEKFGRNIAGSQYRKYIRLQRGEFAYNRGNSKQFPQGCVYQLTEFDEVAASNAFYCFRLYDHLEPAFVLGFFEKNEHGRQLIRHITSGARSNGLLNINADTFFGITVPTPREIAEQQRIADCLSCLDELIAAQAGKLDALRRHKKGLMQKLFPQQGQTVPELRFPEFRSTGNWRATKLGAACHMKAGKFISASDIREKMENGLFPCYGGNGLRGYTTTFTHSGKYPLIGRQGALCGNLKLGVGSFHATEHAVVPSPKAGISVEWLYHLLTHLNLNQYATGQAQPGLSVDALTGVPISIPEKETEQQRIADCLGSLDGLIAAQARKLETLRQHKKGLLQQLFPTLEDR